MESSSERRKVKRQEADTSFVVQVHVRVLGIKPQLILVRAVESTPSEHIVAQAYLQIAPQCRKEYDTPDAYTLRQCNGLGHCTPESRILPKIEKFKDNSTFPYMVALTLDPEYLVQRKRALYQQKQEEHRAASDTIKARREENEKKIIKRREQAQREAQQRYIEASEATCIRTRESARDEKRQKAQRQELFLRNRRERREREDASRADAAKARDEWTQAEMRKQVELKVSLVLDEERLRRAISAEEHERFESEYTALKVAAKEHNSNLWKRTHLSLLGRRLQEKIEADVILYQRKEEENTKRMEYKAERRRQYQLEKDKKRLREQMRRDQLQRTDGQAQAIKVLGETDVLTW